MNTIIDKIRPVVLYILVLFTTGYAALGVFFIICPFEQHFDTVTFAKYWQVVDGYMGKRMPIYGMFWLIVIFLNLLLFFKTWRRSPIFWMILATLVVLIADMVFTGQQQIPINQYIQSLDMNQLTNQQIQKLQFLREQSDKNFELRGIGGWIMFFMMSITPYLLPKLKQAKA